MRPAPTFDLYPVVTGLIDKTTLLWKPELKEITWTDKYQVLRLGGEKDTSPL